jgi:hypothetical protein
MGFGKHQAKAAWRSSGGQGQTRRALALELLLTTAEDESAATFRAELAADSSRITSSLGDSNESFSSTNALDTLGAAHASSPSSIVAGASQRELRLAAAAAAFVQQGPGAAETADLIIAALSQVLKAMSLISPSHTPPVKKYIVSQRHLRPRLYLFCFQRK